MGLFSKNKAVGLILEGENVLNKTTFTFSFESEMLPMMDPNPKKTKEFNDLLTTIKPKFKIQTLTKTL